MPFRPLHHGLAERLRRTGQPSINPEFEAVKWSGKLPGLRIGDMGLCASPKACLSRPEGHLWSAVFCCRLPGRLDSLPAGITVEGATPPRGGLTVNCEVKRLTLPDAALAVKKGGSLPPPSPLSCGAPARRARRGHAGRRPAPFCRRGRGESMLTRVRRGFPGKDSTTAARAALSESAALWLSKACATYVRH